MSFAFDTDSEGILEKLHARGVSVPVLVGVICAIAVVLVLLGQGVWGIATGGGFGSDSSGIEITKSDSGSSESEDAATAEVGQGSVNESSSGSSSSETTAEGVVSDKTELCVDVAGEVKKPGLYRLGPGSRLDDAIRAAGGFTKKAERTSVNLAQPLEDGQQVVVLKKEAGSSVSYSPSASGSNTGGSSASSSSSGASSASSSSAGSSGAASGKVNINTASAEQLTALPGVGDATAAKIVADRDANGRFKKPEDIKRVSGIGDKKFEAMADMIVV